jgi:hypothetical protein
MRFVIGSSSLAHSGWEEGEFACACAQSSDNKVPWYYLHKVYFW